MSNPSMNTKHITDSEFKGWSEMHALATHPTLWVYTSPDNLQSALVNQVDGEVLFITDRRSGAPLYTGPNAKKVAHFEARIKKLI